MRVRVDLAVSPEGRARALGQLRRDEGLRLQPYADAHGDLTIGYGHDLTVGISLAQAEALLASDYDTTEAAVLRRWPWVAGLSEPRQAVVVELAYNVGVAGLGTFRRFLEAAETGRHGPAADELLDSGWADQVGTRAVRLATQYRDNLWV